MLLPSSALLTLRRFPPPPILCSGSTEEGGKGRYQQQPAAAAEWQAASSGNGTEGFANSDRIFWEPCTSELHCGGQHSVIFLNSCVFAFAYTAKTLFICAVIEKIPRRSPFLELPQPQPR